MIGQGVKIIWRVAYSNRIRGEKAENLEMAIAASQAALVSLHPRGISI